MIDAPRRSDDHEQKRVRGGKGIDVLFSNFDAAGAWSQGHSSAAYSLGKCNEVEQKVQHNLFSNIKVA